MAYGAVLSALADPTRREVFERLAAAPHSVAELARTMPVSRPAVSQHLAVLKAAGLVNDQPRGAARIYSVRREGLEALQAWLETFAAEAAPPDQRSLASRGPD
ncbi:MAG: ArsR/SmtB family transcription factor [Hyphomonadaceae bacterium]